MKKLYSQIEVGGGDLRAIKDFYGKSDKETVDTVVSDILDRYFNVEYFDPELRIEDKGS